MVVLKTPDGLYFQAFTVGADNMNGVAFVNKKRYAMWFASEAAAFEFRAKWVGIVSDLARFTQTEDSSL